MTEVPQDRRKEIEEWWALIARIISFVGGLVILISQAFLVELRDSLLIVAGIGMLGPVVAASVAQIVHAIRGHSQHE